MINTREILKGRFIYAVLNDGHIFMYRFAYVEFADKDSAKTALALDESLFKGRQLKVRIMKLYCDIPHVQSHIHT